MESPRQPGDVKAQTRAVASGARGVGSAAGEMRKYPKPPALWRRVVGYTIIPESWALAARFPTRFTLTALLVAILLAAIAAGIGDGMRVTKQLDEIASRYQAAYPEPPLAITPEGELKATPAFKEPILFSFPQARIMIDPTGNTNPESIKIRTLLFTNKEEIACLGNGEGFHYPFSLLPFVKGKEELPITGQIIRELSSDLSWAAGLTVAVALAVGNVLWAAAIMFLLCPLIMIVASTGDRSLLLPKRAAYRMAAAMMVPLVLFGGIMHAAGYSIVYMLGLDSTLLFWFFTAAGLAVWTGFMAKKIYGPPLKQARN